MNTTDPVRLTALAAALLALGAAGGPAPAPATTAQPTAKPAATTVVQPIKPIAPVGVEKAVTIDPSKLGVVDPAKLTGCVPGKRTGRVALIWQYPTCATRPWVLAIVDLATCTVELRSMASAAELDLYLKGRSPDLKGAPTWSVVEPEPLSGTGKMSGGEVHGRLGELSSKSGCMVPELPDDVRIISLAVKVAAAHEPAAK